MKIEPYIMFDGRSEEAAAFYKAKLGAEVVALMRFADNKEVCASGMVPPGAENKVMHMALKIGDTLLMGSDGQCKGQADIKGVSLALQVKDVPESKRVFDALADGGKVEMALSPTFFSPSFGTLTDKFGVGWMVVTDGEPPK